MLRALALMALAALAVAPARAVEIPVDFAHEVLPLLTQHCAKCHTAGRYEGEFSLDTREALLDSGAVEPGAAQDSVLIDRVASHTPDYRMPPEGEGLSEAEVAVLRRWIDADLPWEPGFSFEKDAYEAPLEPRRPELPPASAGRDNPIDRIVYAYWDEHGISPPAELDDAAWLRRVHLDLVGLLPDVKAVEAFVADGDPRKRARVVGDLLADPVAYSDHWMSFWNDLLRNDYAGAGFIDGGRKQITRWLYQALLTNMPYDEFVRQLIAPSGESEGFGKGIVWRGQVNASQAPPLQFSQNVSQVFLGINLKCASCHDSFVDKWKLTDAYGLAAIASDTPLELHRCDKPTGATAEARFLFPELGTVDPQAPREQRLAQLAKLMTDPRNGRLTRTVVNRLWHRLMGRGVVHPVDSMGAAPWNEDLLDLLAIHLADEDYDLKQTLALIATSQVYGLQTVPWDEAAPADEYVFAGPAAKRMTAEQFSDAISSLTGVAADKTADDEVFVRLAADASKVRRPFVRASLVTSNQLMRTLGRPNREQVVTARPAELTTLEALELSNGAPLAQLLDAGAARLMAEHPGATAEELCQIAFKAALAREASEQEIRDLAAVVGAPLTPSGLADGLWCIVMLPEFQIVR
ncbi:MAG TPA: PSD1 and planctomycete cytochrome C domain-containing protein [Lacipirellulaceae bacterium]|nr:PSD1 and planctomycete cytochrome C domain-containing protein [Lacipirellulaceae bacterium]